MELEAKEALILGLFRAYPGKENSISRTQVEQYLKAVEFFSAELVKLAIDRFVTGQVERDKKSRGFIPSADELATEIRNVRYNQGVGNRLITQGRKQIEARDRDAEIEAARTPESMAKVRKMVAEFADSVSEDKRTPEEVEKMREMMRKTDEHFSMDFIAVIGGRPVSVALAKNLGYEVEDGKA